MRLALLAFLLMWDQPDCELGPLTYRVEQVHRYQIGVEQGVDQDGKPTLMPIYSPWVPVFIQLDPMRQAVILCEPAVGEMCAAVVTAIDEAGNVDDGSECA